MSSKSKSDPTQSNGINIESADNISSIAKKTIQLKTKKNNKIVKESKPKLIIKIPKPFALGYITINIGNLFGNLLSGLSAALLALILAKLADSLFDFLKDKLFESNGELPQSDIDSAFNIIDINSIIDKSTLEYNELLYSGYDANGYDANGYDANGYDANGYDANGYDANGYDANGYDINGYDIDGFDANGYDINGLTRTNYTQTNKNGNKSSKYTTDKRNRTDIMNSEIVKNRNSKNIKIIKNPNYGSYYN